MAHASHQRWTGWPAGSLAAAALALTVHAAPAAAQRVENAVAIFAALDKVTAKISRLEVPLNQTATFGALKVTPRVCYTRAPTEPPKTTTFVEVEEMQLDGKEKRIFTGWMFAESPGLNAVEHPVFDVWLTDCIQPRGPAPRPRKPARRRAPRPIPSPLTPTALAVPRPAVGFLARSRRRGMVPAQRCCLRWLLDRTGRQPHPAHREGAGASVREFSKGSMGSGSKALGESKSSRNSRDLEAPWAGPGFLCRRMVPACNRRPWVQF